MTTPALYLSSLALLLAAVPAQWPADMPAARAPGQAAPGQAAPVRAAIERASPPPAMSFQAGEASETLRVLDEARTDRVRNQVRIEQRVIIRISPSSSVQRQSIMNDLPRRPITTTYQEVDHGDCVAVDDIAGVQPVEDHRLLLFMQDRRVLSAALERSCNAGAFYSGFYVERHADGNLCVARDRLQSRSGASCQVNELHRLVALRN